MTDDGHAATATMIVPHLCVWGVPAHMWLPSQTQGPSPSVVVVRRCAGPDGVLVYPSSYRHALCARFPGGMEQEWPMVA